MALDSNLSLGQFLRQEREKRGITIEQVASATKIGVRTLHTIESDHYSDLPAKPFVRGFVASYARFIGLDHKEVLTHYSTFLEEKLKERPNRDGGHSGYAFEKREGGDQSRMFLGFTMGGFVLIGAVALLVFKPSLHSHHGSHLARLRAANTAASPVPEASPSVAAASNIVAVASPSPVAEASPSPQPHFTAAVSLVAEASPTPAPVVVAPKATPSAAPTPASAVVAKAPQPAASPSPVATPAAADPLNSGLGLKPSEIAHRLVCKALQSVWVRYRVDDKPQMQFLLRKDKILVLRGKKTVVLQVGNPADIQISHNGAGYQPASEMKNLTTRQNDATFFYPQQLAGTLQEPFPSERPLTGRVVPPPPVHPASATSAE